jgi:DNA primase
MFDDDRVEAKYLNTSETPIYRKSQVLYGIDLARKQISASSQAVVVEGYTDVMACHQSGVRTAVATCGTAFGDDHARVLRRVLLDHDAMRGEVIFTFDGDEAGQRAAMKAFKGDQQFVAQTYVAVEPRGMDPCDLRLADGDAAVRELVASRIPLYRFVLENTLSRFDLDRADQRVDAVREAVGLVTAIRDKSKVEEFFREIATKVGVDVDQVRAENRRRKAPAQPKAPAQSTAVPAPSVPSSPPEEATPEPQVSFGAPQFADEREALKAITQYPHLAREHIGDVHENDFTHPVAQEIWRHVSTQELPDAPDPTWVSRLSDALPSDELRHVLSVAAVEPLRARESSTPAVVAATIAQLQALTLARRITELKSKLQRTNPVDQTEAYNRMFGELIALEQQHRAMRGRAIGA